MSTLAEQVEAAKLEVRLVQEQLAKSKQLFDDIRDELVLMRSVAQSALEAAIIADEDEKAKNDSIVDNTQEKRMD